MSPKMREIEIIGCPVDLGAGRRGVGMGPSALRVSGLEPQLRAPGHRVVDGGDLAQSLFGRRIF